MTASSSARIGTVAGQSSTTGIPVISSCCDRTIAVSIAGFPSLVRLIATSALPTTVSRQDQAAFTTIWHRYAGAVLTSAYASDGGHVRSPAVQSTFCPIELRHCSCKPDCSSRPVFVARCVPFGGKQHR
jgi:hypothetical protein